MNRMLISSALFLLRDLIGDLANITELFLVVKVLIRESCKM